MNETPSTPWEQRLRDEAEAIVRRGREVRGEIDRLVASASHECHRQADGLARLGQAVLDGAVRGAGDAGGPVLHEVVSGLGDGFRTAAGAAQFTLEEARGRGRRFAGEDLGKVAADFRGLAALLVELVERAVQGAGAEVRAQAGALADHARHTATAVAPALEAAARTAAGDPVQLGREVLSAGSGAVQEAAGVLFHELGRRLSSAGDRLRHPPGA